MKNASHAPSFLLQVLMTPAAELHDLTNSYPDMKGDFAGHMADLVCNTTYHNCLSPEINGEREQELRADIKAIFEVATPAVKALARKAIQSLTDESLNMCGGTRERHIEDVQRMSNSIENRGFESSTDRIRGANA